MSWEEIACKLQWEILQEALCDGKYVTFELIKESVWSLLLIKLELGQAQGSCWRNFRTHGCVQTSNFTLFSGRTLNKSNPISYYHMLFVCDIVKS